MESDKTLSDFSSVSSDGDQETSLQSMAAKGIKRLCSELLELKRASDEDFHKNIFSNYSAFVRIFKEVEGMENVLLQLKNHISTQKRLVKDLVDGVYLKALSEETIDSIIEESELTEPHRPSKLEAHTNDVSETLDFLLSEHRFDEALDILEMGAVTFQRIQLEEKSQLEVLTFYNTAIAERKAILSDQLTLVAENPRIAAPELQQALVGLCRLGNSHLATQLLLKYYHSRIATGIHNLQSSKSFLHGIYIRELAKCVFSMISQAAKGFIVLYGETSPYASELIQWACEETKVFVGCFNSYVKSISEISGGLSSAVEAVQVSMSYCSLLETQRIVLRPCLVKHIRPCMEEVLRIHIDHFKKVIGIITATDNWVLGKYLVSGILNGGCSSMALGQQPQYCVLTNSGRKFVTLLRAITEDVSPLVALQMEGSIFRGLAGLFTEYTVLLERALVTDINVIEKAGSRFNLAVSFAQQVSVLANLSTLVHFFSGISQSIFKNADCFNSEITKPNSDVSQTKELDNCILLIKGTSEQIRIHFCEQYICRIFTLNGRSRITLESYFVIEGDDAMPSAPFQELFFELENLEKLAEANVVELDWLMELLKDVMEATFVWIANNEDFWTTTEEDFTAQYSSAFKQFVLDVQFLIEIARRGGYFSDDMMNISKIIVDRVESAFLSDRVDPKRDVIDDGWTVKAATEAIQKLLEIEKTKPPPNKEQIHVLEDTNQHQSEHSSKSFLDDSRSCSDFSVESEEKEDDTTLNTSIDLLETERDSDDEITNVSDTNSEAEEVQNMHAVNEAISELRGFEEMEITGQ